MTDAAEYQRLASEIAKEQEADIIIFSGSIRNEAADRLIRLVKQDKARRANVILLLTTRGGDADAAFRMTRCLQKYYKKLTLYIYGRCKSAGTLVAVGANEIVLSDYGEFGPLDVQLEKKDELYERASGLDVTQALTSLNQRTLSYFRTVLMDIRYGSNGQISTKLAAELATNISTTVHGKIYEQIDPVQLGALERAMMIAHEYGKRLKSSNVKNDALDRLASGYSSHSFVIDINEARQLFDNVREPTEKEEELGECISFATRDEPDGQTFVEKLNKAEEPNEQARVGNQPGAEDQPGSGEAREGGVADHATADREAGAEQRAGPRPVAA